METTRYAISVVRNASAASAVVLALCALVGCQQGSPSGTSSVWGQPPPGDQSAQIAEMMKRQQEQAALAQQQRQQLEYMSQVADQQNDHLRTAEQQRYQDELRKLQEQAALARAELRKNEQMLQGADDWKKHTANLDASNRDLHTKLARAEQNQRLLEDQLKLMQTRLRDSSQQLSQALNAKDQSDKRLQTLQASMSRQASATIKPNTSLYRNVTAISIPGVDTRQDGDVVRMVIPSDDIFIGRSASLNQSAVATIQQVGNAVAANYPRQIVGIECHTDVDPMSDGRWRSHHQLTAAQAVAIFDQMTKSRQVAPEQLFVLGHGSNHPIASNATPAGKQQNRRTEVVIYPETVNDR